MSDHIRSGVRRLFDLAARTPGQVRREVDDEVALHLELRIRQLEARGYTPEAARAEALRRMGGSIDEVRHRLQHSAAHREHRLRARERMSDFMRDVRRSLRGLARRPTFAVVAILTLALGIGANAAIYTVLHAVVLRPLPFRDPERLVMLWEEHAERGWYKQDAAPANMLDWREQVAAFEDVAAYPSFESSTTLMQEGRTELLSAMEVTGNFFSVLGVPALTGRTFTVAETWATGERIVMISERLWRTRFAADPGLVGRSIELGGRPAQVIGVVPSSFAFPGRDPDVWFRTGWAPDDRSQVWFRRAHWLDVIARLRPGVAPQEAEAQLEVVVSRLERDYPETNRGMGAGLTPLHEFLVGDTRGPLLVLQGAVLLLLIIACANVGNLLLVRAADREREAVLRLALGASRGRVVREALIDSVALSALGGLAGLVLGAWGTKALVALQPERMLPVGDIHLNTSVVLFVLAITILSAVLFGVAPAAWSGLRAPADALKEGGRSSTSRSVRRWGNALVVGEVAIALLMAVGAGLLMRSFWQLQRVDPGVDVAGVLSTTLALPPGRFDSAAKVRGYHDGLLQRVRGLPGVESAAIVSELPMTARGWSSDFSVEGRPPRDHAVEVVHREISPDYHRVMRVPLVAGRTFSDTDRGDAPLVVLINEALADRYFSGESPLGRRIAFDRVPDSTSVWRTIVGVVGNEHQEELEQAPRPEFFAPYAQDQVRSRMPLVVRTSGDAAALEGPLRRLVAELDPSVAIAWVRPMTVVRDRALARQRFIMTLVLVFGAVGLALAIVGVYGIMAQVAARRTREIGIRVALGASTSRVQWLVVRHGLRLVVAGIVLGAGVALAATGLLRALLFGVSPSDPVTFAAVAALLVAATLAASWVPAWRASRVDPAITLRSE
ncbi:MAG TPA: ABC transporter permease [Gemmatimonadaceae bacterium]|nr:ABC transporter permease [Gemmatimonadaceae bacterium]